jgi:hypothetical protein
VFTLIDDIERWVAPKFSRVLAHEQVSEAPTPTAAG